MKTDWLCPAQKSLTEHGALP